MPYGAAFDLVRRYVAEGRLPSAVLGIADANGTVALHAFGAEADDRYPLFSITKPLVGIAAARAIERGLLSPNTPLNEAVGEFGVGLDDPTNPIRLWHLASHTAGLSEPPLDTPTLLRTELLSRGRDFAPGTAWSYSTLAFEGIAALIEHATGNTWDAEVAAWAAEIGATGISLDLDSAHPIPDAAAGGVDMDRFAALRNPGAGLAARADDLLRLGSALLRIGDGEADGILQPATLAMMRRPVTTGIPHYLAPDAEPEILGTGTEVRAFTWNTHPHAPGLIDRDLYGHGGWAGTEFWVHPSAGVAWVLLTGKAIREGVDREALDNAIIGAR